MKFIVKNKNTGEIISPRNYYFVIKQNGELFTFNGAGKFEKANTDLGYELSEQQTTTEAKETTESEALHIGRVRLSSLISELQEKVTKYERLSEDSKTKEHAIRFAAKAMEARDNWKAIYTILNEA